MLDVGRWTFALLLFTAPLPARAETQSIEHLTAAAAQGDAEAQFLLGRAHANGVRRHTTYTVTLPERQRRFIL